MEHVETNEDERQQGLVRMPGRQQGGGIVHGRKSKHGKRLLCYNKDRLYYTSWSQACDDSYIWLRIKYKGRGNTHKQKMMGEGLCMVWREEQTQKTPSLPYKDNLSQAGDDKTSCLKSNIEGRRGGHKMQKIWEGGILHVGKEQI